MSFSVRILNSPSASLLLSCALAGTCAQLGYELGQSRSALKSQVQHEIRCTELTWTDSEVEQISESQCPLGTIDTGSSCTVSVPTSKLL